jgi:predicted amidophosphoribosyltransferase
MSLLSEIWHYQPRSCLKCGSFFVQPSLFCSDCFSTFCYAEESLFFRQDPVETHYLFEWRPAESDSLSKLFRELKGTNQSRAWDYYASLFWSAASRRLDYYHDDEIILVPSPARDAKVLDHAGLFCRSLSKASGFPMLPILQRKDYSEQKTKRRRERLSDRFSLVENISGDLLSGKRILFVDDILTTGQTAVSAQKAIGNSKNFTVWALASRALGCGGIPDLL